MTDSAPIDRLDALRERLRQFVAERDWSRFHDPKNLAMAIASEAGELLAELRWTSTAEADEFVRQPANQERIQQEVGDIVWHGFILLMDRSVPS